jgi:hypothetical protein
MSIWVNAILLTLVAVINRVLYLSVMEAFVRLARKMAIALEILMD